MAKRKQKIPDITAHFHLNVNIQITQRKGNLFKLPHIFQPAM